MNWSTILFGFVSGAISASALIAGTLYMFLPKLDGLVRVESLRDLSYYGRKLPR